MTLYKDFTQVFICPASPFRRGGSASAESERFFAGAVAILRLEVRCRVVFRVLLILFRSERFL